MALTYEKLFKLQEEREEKERASGQRQADVAPVYVDPGFSSFSPSLPSAPTSFSPSNPVIGKPKITVPTVAPIGRNYFDDGYDFGDVTKSILGITSGVGKTIGSSLSSLFGSQQSKKPTISAFDDSLMQKYSTMSLSDIEREYSRVEKEEELFRNANGGKAYNYLAKLGAGAFVGSDQSGNALSSHGLAKANIDKLNDFAREKEIISMFRKQKATEELLGGLSEEQLKLLDNIAEGKASEDIAPFYLTSQGVDANTYYKTTEVERTAGKVAREKLQKQLKDKNPDKNEEELDELIDNMVELRKSQRNAEEQAATQEQIKAQATEHPVASFLASRFTNLLGGPLGLSELYMQRGNEYGLDTNAPGFALTNASNTIDEQVQLDHDWKIGGVDAFDLFYEAGTGIVDNVARLAISGGNTTVASVMMFPQITTQSIIEGKKKGYSDSKALALGLLNGTFEAVSGKLSLDAILGSKGGVLKKLAKSFATEGSEEVTSSWLNRIADQIANGKHSELSKQYNSLLSEGYTESQALAETTLSVIGEDTKAFVISGIAGTVLGSGNIAVNAVSNVAQKNAPVELDEKAQTVVDKIVEEKIAEAVEKNNGKAISKYKQKQIRESVIQAMDKGYITKDTIESILGGEEYDNYKEAKDLSDSNIADGKKVVENLEKVKKNLQAEYDTLYKMKNGEKTDEQKDRQSELKDKIANIDAEISKISGVVEKLGNDTRLSDLKAKLDANVYEIVKDSRLAESYREVERSQQAYESDTSKYKNEKARQTVQNAIDSGLFGNSNAEHEAVDFVAKVTSKIGLVCKFETKEQIKNGFIEEKTKRIAELENIPEAKRTAKQNKLLADMKDAVEQVKSGKLKVNGNITNGVITIDPKSAKGIEFITGHEILHHLVKSKVYRNGDLGKAFKSYLGEEEFANRLKKAEQTYRGDETDPGEENLADLTGEFIFNDYDFVMHLATTNHNIFRNFWDSINHLYKMATAGSKEARELERVKRNFEKAYKEIAKSGAKVEGTKNSLSSEQEAYFKDSKVRDENGNLKVMYHGTSKGGFNSFDTYGSNYGLMGTGSYFTDNKSVAESYTNKGKGNNKQVYESYLNITNPLDMDAQGNAEEWAKAFPDVDFSESGTNEQFYREVEEFYSDQMMSKWEVAEIIRDSIQFGMGYDGITHIGGGRVNADGTRHQVYIAFEPEQIKNIDNIAPTSNPDIRYSLSSMGNTFFGDPDVSAEDFENGRYKEAEGYKAHVDIFVNNYRQTMADFDEATARKSIEHDIDGIVKVAMAAKRAGYDIYDDNEKRNATDSKKRLLFSSLEPNSDYFTSHDISTECDKRKNFADIYDAIVKKEETMGVPHGKRFFDDVDNYFYIHKVLADKGLTQPCRQCYLESMRKNLAPMARNFIKLVTERDANNKSNDQLYQQLGKNKGNLKSNNAKLREKVLEALAEYEMSADELTIEKLTTADGLAELKLCSPNVYELFNSFYGQSKPKMPRKASPYRFGELTTLLTDENGKIKQSLVDKINATGSFRLQSYSDHQTENFVDTLQVLFEAGTLGLSGHAYTKVPAFLDVTEGTNLKRNISIFMYKDGNEWKLDKNDSFPYELDEIYDIVNNDATGNTSIVAVSQNDDMSAWIMANDYVGYGIPFHKSGLKMGTVRDTDVKTDDGRIVKGYSGIKDHTRQQTEVWAKTTADHKAFTKVKKGINIYGEEVGWDFDNEDGLSRTELIEKNLKAYIDACEEAGYLPKFRDYVTNKNGILNKTLQYAKEFGFAYQDATIEDISFEYKGYTIPYGYYKFLGDWGMFTPDGKAAPQKTLSLANYDFEKAVEFFADSEKLHRNEILQQFANGEERAKYRNSKLNAGELADIVRQKRDEVVDSIVAPVKNSLSYDDGTDRDYGTFYGRRIGRRNITTDIAPVQQTVSKTENVAPVDEAENATATDDIAPIQTDSNLEKSEELRLTLAASPHFTKYAEKAYFDMDAKKDKLRETFEAKKALYEHNKEITKDKNTYIKNEAFNLYIELKNLKKGVRASRDLGYLLDNGFDWSELKSTLLKVSRNPDKVLNPDSTVESVVREMLLRGHEALSSYSIEGLEADYNRQVKELEDITKQSIDNFLDKLVRESQTRRYHEEILGDSQLGTKAPVEKKGGTWSDFVRNFVSKGAVFETTALKTGNRALEDKYKMWKDRSEAKAQYFMENGSGDVKSLKSIVDNVKKAGLYKEFDLYLKHRHNVSRMYFDKAIFGYDVSGEMSLKEASKLQKQHPEFKEWAKDVYKYNDYLLQKTVDGGLISQDFANELSMKYPNYVPIERILDGSVQESAEGVFVGNPIKTATGGESDTENVLKAMAHRTTQVFKAVDKNAFGVELKNTLGGKAEASGVNTADVLNGLAEMDEGLLQPGKSGKNPTFTVFVNGKRKTFEISEEMYKALQPTTEAMSREHKLFSVPSKLHKKVLTEYNLFFTARNFPKDAQEVIFNSKHPAKTYANMPKAVSELITGGKYATEYWENGGKSNTYFDGRENDFSQDDGIAKKAIGLVPNGISKVNDFVEAIPRLAEYIASRKKGATIEASMLDAARVTTDFADGGDITKFFNRNGFTFLNASVQGASQQVRNIRQAKAEGFKGVMKLVGKYALSGLPTLLFNHLMWDDDEEYEDLSEYVKDSYYVVAKHGDGQFVRIPKGRTAAVIQEAVDQVCDLITSDEVNWDDIEQSIKTVGQSFASNLAPNNPLENHVLAPIFQAKSGTAWYGDDIVPTRLQDLPAKEQFDESTDSISKWLGEKTGISPYKINYLLNQYSGFVGDIVLPPLTPEAERGDGSALGNLLAPLKDQFVVDAVIKNRNPSDFYTLSDELEVKANSKNATDEDRVKSAYITNISYEMGDLYKQKREIQNSNLSDGLKFKQVREIQSQINEMAQNALETYDDVEVDGKYATINGIPYKYLEDKGKWYELYDYEVEKMNDATKLLDITPGEYWSNKDEYDMKAFYPEKYAVLQEEGISVKEYKEKYEEKYTYYADDFSWAGSNPDKYTFSKAITDSVVDYRKITSELYAIRADKDENGNSISGTAKSKKQAYIWSLDIEEPQKYLLFKNEYNSYDDHNQEIVDYIIGRGDLTFEEKKTILTNIGFTVDDNGRISG